MLNKCTIALTAVEAAAEDAAKPSPPLSSSYSTTCASASHAGADAIIGDVPYPYRYTKIVDGWAPVLRRQSEAPSSKIEYPVRYSC